MKIAGLALDSPLILAPLAGYTDSPMRRICRSSGASMVWTEMVSAEGIVRAGAKSLALLDFRPEERPIAFQLFGAAPESMGRAALRVEGLGPDAIDVNAGCPSRKVVNGGSGAALMREPGLLADIVSAVVEATTLPVTVKIRSGWDDDSINAVEIASIAAARGASAVVLHPRSRREGFGGAADWRLIRSVREAVSVPVIGSGDVRTPEDAVRMLRETGCAAVMVGRAAVGNPWIFTGARALLEGRPVPPPPTLCERLATVVRHLDLMVEAKGERRGVLEMRKHIVAYLRGFPGASKLRSELVRMEGHGDVRRRLNEAIEDLG